MKISSCLLEARTQKPTRGKIFSFVHRQSHFTKGQKRALEELWPELGIKYKTEVINFTNLFNRTAPVILEVGFGMGSSLVAMASQNPQYNFLGIEVHKPGIGACLSMVRSLGIKNIRIICHDAVEVIETMIPIDSLYMVQIFFPDPWHKVRHNKRRLVQVLFAKLVLSKLELNGIFHLATDWKDYAEHVLQVMNSIKGYQNQSTSGKWITRPVSRPITKFERRGQQLGHDIWDLMFKKIQ
ncbi:tRNA (guanosine(46)-N7)-methyltransferase TrmB [Candidatus Erwinia haradaeae]|uniref:tRNA (guanine-N(7)-)-methyltransferase n=1 Tax=Candidatus Erwinia haradaeae TaxID=1922217 RepID=A0A803FT02_9GAMM|nr:tRNA (guanosine(46)-N7)-methyltransferase TrmB [Candidatus Erwinia haradaeae]VFP87413.1 tRNA (guanine-N(7)-)-methyltransferase [Candidatus Erwinia haradaeae]